MTDDEARAILRGGSAYIDYDKIRSRPHWLLYDEPTITLDGQFTADELRAILHFAPKAPA